MARWWRCLGCCLVVLWLWGCASYDAARGNKSAGPSLATMPALVPSDGGDRFFAYTSPGDLPALRLMDGADALPLRHTAVQVEIVGMVARVQVSQTYTNTHEEPIEAVYTFPLPENSAVDDMRMVIGDRTITAQIEQREQARRIYENARSQGRTTALLEQERANVFTQSVANIAPREDIDVVIRYVQTLTYDAGEYEFVFPMVVGPRYTDDRVADAARVTPPVAGPGTRTGHDISLTLAADPGLPIRGFDVPTHQVTGGMKPDGTLSLSLASRKTLPNRDFVLRYGVAGQAVVPTLLLDGDDTGGHFALVIQPPDVDVDALVGARELIFVVDVSGSMNGVPLSICQAAMREAIMRLRPVDTFNIITFSGRTAQAFDEARPANEHNVREALAFLRGLRAGGSTQILDAVDVALADGVGSGRHRYVFFLTDGYVAIEDEVHARTRRFIDTLDRRGQRARVFSMGVGGSPNRELLDALAKAGDGLAVVVTTREDPREAVGRFYGYIDHPIWTNLSVEWGSMKVVDVHPQTLPDLFATRPTVVHGRYVGAPASAVTLRARFGQKSVRSTATATKAAVGPEVIGTLWARARIGELQRQHAISPQGALVEQITALGLGHRLVTPYTSFVAVDESRVVGSGDPVRIEQVVEAPEGVDVVSAGARIAHNQVQRMAYADVDMNAEPSMADSEDAPELTSRRVEREDSVDYEREPESTGGCAHCGRRRGGDPGVVVEAEVAYGLDAAITQATGPT